MGQAGRLLLAAGLAAICAAAPAAAQKSGGILKEYMVDSPASMSIHEEATVVSTRPMMAVFNNLVLYDQREKQNRPDTIVPDLATGWSWNEEGTELTFPLRQGVKWHDGKPFTAADVKCTWEMIQGKTADKLRVNPRKSWYRNLEEVTTAGDHEVTFRLKRPQPSFLALLAGGLSPVYPCHVPAKDMRQHPIGTGPFKFVDFKPNEHIKVAKNPDYWKPGRPYLDGIEYTITKNRSTAILAFIAGKYELTFAGTLSVPLTRDVMKEVPQAICQMPPGSVSVNVILNRAKPPFDNPDLRRAVGLGLDRQAFIDILTEGIGSTAGVMQGPPEGLWGLPPEVLRTLPGYGPDVAKNRAEARRLMQQLGYGPDKRLSLKLSARDIPPSRDPGVILIDQLKEIYIDAELEPVDTTNWFPKVIRHDFVAAINLTPGFTDDPDQVFYTSYVCGAEQNYTGYCNPAVDKMIEHQSMEANLDKRKQLVWEIERKLAEDDARPIIFYGRGGTCRQPQLKGLTVMVNSIYNGWRMEDVWLDR
jgi:peptide/nickel transport system substrate-binding protein